MAPVPDHADTVARRRDVLVALSTPRTKPELVDDIDASRSTVDRAIDALMAHDFVDQRGSEYVATYAGRAAVDAYERFLSRLGALDAVQPVVGEVPPTVDIPPAVFDGATVRTSSPEAPELPVEETVDIVMGATVFRGTGPAILSRYIEVFEALVEGGTDIELVFTEAVIETLSETYRESLEMMKAAGAIALYVTDESLPYAIWTAERSGMTVSGIIVYGTNGPAGIVSNDTAAMNEWVSERYRAIKHGARRLD